MLRQDDRPFPLEGVPTVCAYNPTKTRVAITDGSRLMIRATSDAASDGYPTSSSLPSDCDVSTSIVDTVSYGAITSMCWAGEGQGHVIVCGTEKGVIMMYSEGKNERMGISNAGYGMVGEVARYSTSAVVCIERVDGIMGNKRSAAVIQGAPATPSTVASSTLVAVGHKDGVVRLYECSALDDSSMLRLHSVIQCPVDGVMTRAACIASSVSPPSPAHAGDTSTIVLLVGYVAGSDAASKSLLRAYQYDACHFTWEEIELGIDLDDSGAPGGPIASIAWAPLMGRDDDLIAVAVGTAVKLYSMRGALSNVVVKEVATLSHPAAVWQVKVNMTGTWLAASTDNNEVCLWRPDLTGEWVLLNTIRGDK